MATAASGTRMLNNQPTLEGFMRLRIDLVYEGFAKKRELADV
jgi:hypothetical protein